MREMEVFGILCDIFDSTTALDLGPSMASWLVS